MGASQTPLSLLRTHVPQEAVKQVSGLQPLPGWDARPQWCGHHKRKGLAMAQRGRGACQGAGFEPPTVLQRPSMACAFHHWVTLPRRLDVGHTAIPDPRQGRCK